MSMSTILKSTAMKMMKMRTQRCLGSISPLVCGINVKQDRSVRALILHLHAFAWLRVVCHP